MIFKNVRHALRIWRSRLDVARRFDVLLEPAVVIKYPEHITFGKKCTLQAGAYLYGSRAGRPVTLADFVVVAAGATVLGEGGVSIGEGTHLGPHAVVTTQWGDPRGERVTDTPTVRTLPVSIGAGCWIGSGAVIMPGVVLGDRCTVGPGAVVFGRFPADTTLRGNPARAIPPRGAQRTSCSSEGHEVRR